MIPGSRGLSHAPSLRLPPIASHPFPSEGPATPTVDPHDPPDPTSETPALDPASDAPAPEPASSPSAPRTLRSRARGLFADTRPLQNLHFKRLWQANIITVIGAQITIITVPAQLWALTGSSLYVGLTGLFGLVPLVVLGLWGGAIADAFDRRRILLVTTLGLILTSGLFAAQALLQVRNVWVILGIFAAQQAFFAVNQPARTALIPSLVPRDQLPAANALNMTVGQFGAIAGPLVGGALLPFLGFSLLYLIDTVCLLATLWAVLRLPALKPEGAIARPGLRSILDGFVYTWKHKILLVSFAVDLIAMVFGMPRALYPQLADQSFGGPAQGGMEFAALSVAMALGALLGGIFSGWLGRVHRVGLAVLIAVGVWGLVVMGFGGATWLAGGRAMPWLAVAVAFMAAGGIADMISMVFRQTMLQGAASDAVRGRLQGVFLVVVAGGPRFADVAHGAAADVLGAPLTVVLGGALVVLGVAACGVLVPQFTRYRVGPGR
ncbi:MFS transporter [Brachybacterium sp. NPDC056505]|uniref:MFS transporter n=1 Tax=Brachybacterium sp. NPDC056505 TaxID=3345843 RepID=UPI0036709CD3